MHMGKQMLCELFGNKKRRFIHDTGGVQVIYN